MDPKWIGFIVFIAIIMAIIGASAQGGTLELDRSGNSTMDPNVDYILYYSQQWQASPGRILVNPIAHGRFFEAIFSILVGQQNLKAIFPEDSAWIWIWIILWVPIIATVIFGIVMLFFAIIQKIFS